MPNFFPTKPKTFANLNIGTNRFAIQDGASDLLSPRILRATLQGYDLVPIDEHGELW